MDPEDSSFDWLRKAMESRTRRGASASASLNLHFLHRTLTMKNVVLTAAALLAFTAFADDDLKPAQEEAKEALEKDLADNSKEAVGNLSFSSSCSSALLDTMASLCDRPAYKKAILKKVTSLRCNVLGGRAPEKDENYTQAHIKLDKGVFSYTLFKGHTSLTDNGKAVLEKAFN